MIYVLLISVTLNMLMFIFEGCIFIEMHEDASGFFSIYFQVRFVFLYIIITGFKLWSIYRTVTCRHMWVEVWEIIITAFTCFIFDSQYMFVLYFHSLAIICWTFLRHLSSFKDYTNMSYCTLCGIRSKHSDISKVWGVRGI